MLESSYELLEENIMKCATIVFVCILITTLVLVAIHAVNSFSTPISIFSEAN